MQHAVPIVSDAREKGSGASTCTDAPFIKNCSFTQEKRTVGNLPLEILVIVVPGWLFYLMWGPKILNDCGAKNLHAAAHCSSEEEEQCMQAHLQRRNLSSAMCCPPLACACITSIVVCLVIGRKSEPEIHNQRSSFLCY